MKNLALIGAGNIGSRHLQSLANLDQDWKITVVELNAQSMQTAQSRYNEVVQEASPVPIYCDGLDGLPKHVDVCILATAATGRVELIRDILARSKCDNMILEKVVFQAATDFDIAEKLFQENDVKVWVNCTRRQWPIFKELKNDLENAPKIECHFSGEKFAMACNAVHFIDLFQFLSGCAEVSIDGSKLSAPFEDDKRVGSLEFSDTLMMSTSRGDTFQLTSVDTGHPVSSVMTIQSDSLRWQFKQYDLKVGKSSPKTNWKTVEEEVSVPFQSALTSEAVHDIMANGTCELAPFSEARLAHIAMLGAFIDRIEEETGQRPEHCNIT